MTDSFIPMSPDQLTPARLTSILQASGTLPAGERVVDCQYQFIGHGKMGSNARLKLQYSGGGSTAPSSLIGKFPSEDARAREMAGLQGAYYKEVMFYRELAPKTSMKTPVIYANELDDDGQMFFLLMEDISDAKPGNNILGESLENTYLAAREAAKLAASFYGKTEIAEKDYVLSSARDDRGELAQTFMEQCWPGFVDRFGDGISKECLEFGEQYIGRHCHFVCRFSGPRSIVHGDYRSENILFATDAATAVDWQTVIESAPLTDLSYFLGGSVETEDRHQCERKLVEYFRTVLDENGISLTEQECWEQYREYSMHGLMIMILGASFSSPDERGDEMFRKMTARHLQQCVDLGAAEFLQ